MAKEKFNQLLNRAKSSKSKTEIQKVVSVNEIKKSNSKLKNETQFLFYINKNTLKKLKMSAIEEGTSVKAIINKSLDLYFKN